MGFSETNVRRKSLIFLGWTIALSLVLGSVAWVATVQGSRAFMGYVEKDETLSRTIGEIYAQGLQQGQAIRNIMIDPGDGKAAENLEKASVAYLENIKQLIALTSRSGDRSVGVRAGEVSRLAGRDVKLLQEIKGLATGGQPDRAKEVLKNRETPLWRQTKEIILQLKKDLTTQRESSLSTVRADAARNQWLGILLAVVSILGSVGFGYFLFQAFGSLTRQTNRIQETTERVSDFTGQITSKSQSLAESASEQAAAIEETASSLEEMAAITRQSTENANQGSRLSEEASQASGFCFNNMQEMSASLGQLHESSRETKKIVKNIDEIAFQTNLLALNAAVEAARAGEAGAGFAVVASEVRNLAIRAAEAAKSTTDQIEDISCKLDSVMELVSKTIDSFAKVDENTGQVNHLVQEIASAAGEVSQGIDQINRAVGEVEKIIQRNAAGAEESTVAAAEMKARVAELNDVVSCLMAWKGDSASAGNR